MSTFTTVVHRNDPHDVYIGRPSKWGNPFKVGTPGARDECITLYEQWILTQPQLLAALPELHGKRIACHCAPQPCHGDVLARLANELPPAAGATPASGAPQRESQVRIGMTGSRTWTDSETVLKALQWAAKRFQADSKFTLVEGEAAGADRLAAATARSLGWHVEAHPALWDTEGKPAGFRRNERMAASGLVILIAFATNLPTSRGTAHMVQQALALNIPTFHCSSPTSLRPIIAIPTIQYI